MDLTTQDIKNETLEVKLPYRKRLLVFSGKTSEISEDSEE